ncbi:uncharacterized protein LOC129551311 isoform X2 [Moschus berezovskii]|uniref:uncharacterized protein LOC129551311 isoform X2 n=1 Tax=Moschus berezovskii TaxID=68408 RepID=UPI00244417BF|nr:uncharacterized protein LOC129551311 isoform X2 [Moschus berezovskii]XP_055275119.1 uncharacterized protein LOC129551311 isoform X2 [Moschus berezovskii]XP_055275120.1 uncharacterized protein LOC129551311 isoform X2 [Moschus berezovskii]
MCFQGLQALTSPAAAACHLFLLFWAPGIRPWRVPSHRFLGPQRLPGTDRLGVPRSTTSLALPLPSALPFFLSGPWSLSLMCKHTQSVSLFTGGAWEERVHVKGEEKSRQVDSKVPRKRVLHCNYVLGSKSPLFHGKDLEIVTQGKIKQRRLQLFIHSTNNECLLCVRPLPAL